MSCVLINCLLWLISMPEFLRPYWLWHLYDLERSIFCETCPVLRAHLCKFYENSFVCYSNRISKFICEIFLHLVTPKPRSVYILPMRFLCKATLLFQIWFGQLTLPEERRKHTNTKKKKKKKNRFLFRIFHLLHIPLSDVLALSLLMHRLRKGCRMQFNLLVGSYLLSTFCLR